MNLKYYLNQLIPQLDTALRTLHSVGVASKSSPEPDLVDEPKPLNTLDKRHAAGLMRVNHVGEVCAQGLYAGAGLTAKSEAIKQFCSQAAIEERDHLHWCARRVRSLGSHTSYLNPLWYGGAFVMGAVAGALGDKASLSFIRETEAQVEAHLHGHESQLPDQDLASRAIVAQMKLDEIAHGAHAQSLGGQELPAVLKLAMRGTAKIMTGSAYYV